MSERAWSELPRHCAANVHPPLYFAVLKIWCSIAGSSAAAMRGLSLAFVLATVPALALLIREAQQPDTTAARRRPLNWLGAATFAAVLLAVHPLHVEAGRTIRMYALGVLLAVLSSWLLLRALRNPGRWQVGWGMYGIVAALLCYTHNFGLFIVFAQGCFLMLQMLLAAARQRRFPAEVGRGVIVAATAWLVLYWPWLRVVLSQTAEVSQGYWIPDLTSAAVTDMFFGWLIGAGPLPEPVYALYGVGLAIAAAWLIRRHSAGPLLLICVALIPWLCAVAVSLWMGVSILQDRYFVLAHVGVLALAGLLWAELSGIAERTLIAAIVLLPPLTTQVTLLRELPRGEPPVYALIDSLAVEAQPGDIVLVSPPGEVNRIRYYAGQMGSTHLKVQTIARTTGSIHQPHLASLDASDLYFEAPEELRGTQRIFAVSRNNRHVVLPDGSREVWRRRFGPWELALCVLE